MSSAGGDDDRADVVRRLEEQLTQVPLVFADRSDAELSHHAAPEEWCAKQILGHLIEAEGEVFTTLIPGMIGRGAPAGWEQVPGMIREECAMDATELVARWRELRLQGLVLARSLTADDLLRTSDRNWHGGATETAGELFRHWPVHTEAHARQASEALAAAAGGGQ